MIQSNAGHFPRPELDWNPHVELKEGLVKTIEYFEQLLADRNLRDQLTKEVAV